MEDEEAKAHLQLTDLIQKKAEEKLKESETRFRAIADDAPAFMFIAGEDAQVEYLNKTWLQFTGMDFEQAKGQAWSQVTHPDDLQLIFDTYSDAFKNQKPYSFEIRQKGTDGIYHWILWKGIPRFLSDGPFIGMMGIGIDITERKAIEIALKENEEEFRNFSNNIYNLAWMADGDGYIYWYNQRWFDYTGTTLEEMKGWGWEKVHHPAHVKRIVDFAKKAWKNDVPFELTFPLRSKSGEYRWFLTRAVPVKNKDGKVYRWIGTNTDVNDQKLAEERFRTLAETLPQLVWMTDENGKYEYASSQWFNYSGLDPHDETSWEKLVHPNDITSLLKVLSNSLQTGQSYHAEARLKNKEGEYRWHFVHGEPIKNEEGKNIKWIGAFTDIHDQKTLSQKLEKSVQERTAQLVDVNKMLEEKNLDLANAQSFLQQLIDSSVEFISVLDKNLNYITVNKKFESGYGTPRKSFEGKNLLHLNPKVKDTIQYESIMKALEGETVYLDKRVAVAKPEFFVDTYFIPLTIQNKIEGVIIMSRDVTDIVKSEILLAEKNKQLERSNDDLQQFAHVTSHDLKEPLRKIRVYSGLLRDEFGNDLPEKAKNYIAKMENASARMYSMIDGVLLYSSLNAIEQAPELISLSEVMQNIETDLEVEISKKNAAIQYNNLPVIEGSPILIYQLFYNLINNSLKFSKENIAPLIKIKSEIIKYVKFQNDKVDNRENFIQITIEDNGIGFNQANAEKIFKTFIRLNSRDKFEGTGLGLSLCKKIVERHGGTITAEGKEEKGAKFIITLPAK